MAAIHAPLRRELAAAAVAAIIANVVAHTSEIHGASAWYAAMPANENARALQPHPLMGVSLNEARGEEEC